MNPPPDSEGSAEQKEQPDQNAEAVDPPAVPPSPAAHQKTGNGKREPRENEKHRLTSHAFRVWTLAINGVLAGAAIAGGIFYYLQLEQMGTATRVANEQRDAMKGQSDIMKGQLVEMQKATKSATEAADAAKDAVAQTKESMRLDQRAWVTVRIAKVIKPPAMDEIPAVTLHIVNSGKTPALKHRAAAAIYINDTTDLTSQTKTPMGKDSNAVVGPNGEVDVPFDMRRPIVDEIVIQQMKEERSYLYIAGVIFYEDVFERPHRTNFCFRINGAKLFEQGENARFMWSADIGNTAD
jgi:hypothetical protein